MSARIIALLILASTCASKVLSEAIKYETPITYNSPISYNIFDTESTKNNKSYLEHKDHNSEDIISAQSGEDRPLEDIDPDHSSYSSAEQDPPQDELSYTLPENIQTPQLRISTAQDHHQDLMNESGWQNSSSSEIKDIPDYQKALSPATDNSYTEPNIPDYDNNYWDMPLFATDDQEPNKHPIGDITARNSGIRDQPREDDEIQNNSGILPPDEYEGYEWEPDTDTADHYQMSALDEDLDYPSLDNFGQNLTESDMSQSIPQSPEANAEQLMIISNQGNNLNAQSEETGSDTVKRYGLGDIEAATRTYLENLRNTPEEPKTDQGLQEINYGDSSAEQTIESSPYDEKIPQYHDQDSTSSELTAKDTYETELNLGPDSFLGVMPEIDLSDYPLQGIKPPRDQAQVIEEKHGELHYPPTPQPHNSYGNTSYQSPERSLDLSYETPDDLARSQHQSLADTYTPSAINQPHSSDLPTNALAISQPLYPTSPTLQKPLGPEDLSTTGLSPVFRYPANSNPKYTRHFTQFSDYFLRDPANKAVHRPLTKDSYLLMLTAAIKDEDIGLIQALIMKLGSVDHIMPNGDTALITAVRMGRIKSIRSLLHLGADVRATGHGREDALQTAERSSPKTIAALLDPYFE